MLCVCVCVRFVILSTRRTQLEIRNITDVLGYPQDEPFQKIYTFLTDVSNANLSVLSKAVQSFQLQYVYGCNIVDDLGVYFFFSPHFSLWLHVELYNRD